MKPKTKAQIAKNIVAFIVDDTLISLYWDWNEGRKQIESFSKDSSTTINGKATSYNLITPVTAQNFIRVVMAYAFNRAHFQYGYKLLRGADFDKKDAVDEYLRNQKFGMLRQLKCFVNQTT